MRRSSEEIVSETIARMEVRRKNDNAALRDEGTPQHSGPPWPLALDNRVEEPLTTF
jgi:hypothetical protein